MTLTIDEKTIELPAPVQDALEADAQAQSRPAADVVADLLAASYGLPVTDDAPVLKAVTDSVGVSDTSGAAVLAQWEKDGVFLPMDDLPDSPELARQIREQAQAPRFDSTGRRF